MTGGADNGWAVEQAAFDPDGLYLSLVRFLAGDGTGAEDAYLPYPPAADLLRDGGRTPPPVRAPGPRREAVSLVAGGADGLVVHASDTLAVPDAGWLLRIGDTGPRPVRPVPAGGTDGEGLRRLVVPWPADAPPAPGATVVLHDGATLLFDGPAPVPAAPAADLRVQFRRFSGDALWFGPDGAGALDAAAGPLPFAIRGEAGSVWRWGEPTLDKEGRALWRVALDGLARPGVVQDWRVALPGGTGVSRGRFLTFADDKDRFWMRPPERAAREVAVTVVRDRARQPAALAVLLVTRDALVLEGAEVADPPGFAFRARDNSWRFALADGQEPAHVSVRRADKELFRLDRFADRAGEA